MARGSLPKSCLEGVSGEVRRAEWLDISDLQKAGAPLKNLVACQAKHISGHVRKTQRLHADYLLVDAQLGADGEVDEAVVEGSSEDAYHAVQEQEYPDPDVGPGLISGKVPVPEISACRLWQRPVSGCNTCSEAASDWGPPSRGVLRDECS